MQDLLLRIWCSSVTRIHEMKDSDRGATAIEYSMKISLIATVLVVVVKVAGAKSNNSFTLNTTL